MIQRLSAILFFFVILFVAQLPAMAKDKSYTLVCRGATPLTGTVCLAGPPHEHLRTVGSNI